MSDRVTINATYENRYNVTVGDFDFWVDQRFVRDDRSLTPRGKKALAKAKTISQYDSFAIRAEFIKPSGVGVMVRLPFYYLESLYRVEIELPRIAIKSQSFEGVLLDKSWFKNELLPLLLSHCPPNSLTRKIRCQFLEYGHPLLRPRQSDRYCLRVLIAYADHQLLSSLLCEDKSDLFNVLFEAFVAKRSIFTPSELPYRLLDLFSPNLLSVLVHDQTFTDELQERLRKFNDQLAIGRDLKPHTRENRWQIDYLRAPSVGASDRQVSDVLLVQAKKIASKLMLNEG